MSDDLNQPLLQEIELEQAISESGINREESPREQILNSFENEGDNDISDIDQESNSENYESKIEIPESEIEIPAINDFDSENDEDEFMAMEATFIFEDKNFLRFLVIFLCLIFSLCIGAKFAYGYSVYNEDYLKDNTSNMISLSNFTNAPIKFAFNSTKIFLNKTLLNK